MATASALQRLIPKARADESVLAVLLYGSAGRGEAVPASDVDVCLVLWPYGGEPATSKGLEYLPEFDLDLHVFQGLPLPIRRRVLKEGRVLLSKDDDALNGLAVRAVQAFEDFEHLHYAYPEAVLDAGP